DHDFFFLYNCKTCEKKTLITFHPFERLCSLHFKQDCFISCQARVTLKPDAVPTIFYPHCHVKAKVRHTRVSKNTTVNRGAYTLSNSPSPLKRKVSFVQSHLRSCKKKLKLQGQRVRRLKQKVNLFVIALIVFCLILKQSVLDTAAFLQTQALQRHHSLPSNPMWRKEGKMVRRLFVLL
uniref:THAP-type domain-containing protein n=1 Tax=Sander lucioperca TaxID=283035 RepID=A0A8C9ZVY2_SANLU